MAEETLKMPREKGENEIKLRLNKESLRPLEQGREGDNPPATNSCGNATCGGFCTPPPPPPPPTAECPPKPKDK
jgi:hypothetical protein